MMSRMSAVVSACVRSATDFFGLRGDGDEVLDICKGCRTLMIPFCVVVLVDGGVEDRKDCDGEVYNRTASNTELMPKFNFIF